MQTAFDGLARTWPGSTATRGAGSVATLGALGRVVLLFDELEERTGAAKQRGVGGREWTREFGRAFFGRAHKLPRQRGPLTIAHRVADLDVEAEPAWNALGSAFDADWIGRERLFVDSLVDLPLLRRFNDPEALEQKLEDAWFEREIEGPEIERDVARRFRYEVVDRLTGLAVDRVTGELVRVDSFGRVVGVVQSVISAALIAWRRIMSRRLVFRSRDRRGAGTWVQSDDAPVEPSSVSFDRGWVDGFGQAPPVMPWTRLVAA